MAKILCNLVLLFGIAGCQSDSPINPTATAPVAATAPIDTWNDVTAALEAHVVDDLVFIVGDADGELFRYSKGGLSAVQTLPVASASKWLTSATLLALVEQGVLHLSDHPQQYLEDWTDDPGDARSRVTLEHLLSFTSGFNYAPSEPGCIGDESYSLYDCALEFHNAGLSAEPGATFYYGPAHMQIAVAMASSATGLSWPQIFRLTLKEPLGLSDSTEFSGDNSRASGAATSSANDYAAFLHSMLSRQFLADSFENLGTPRTLDVDILFRPASLSNGTDWHYGLGAWRECHQPQWNVTCEEQRRLSSPGAFGWHPWIEENSEYYAVLAVNEPLTLFDSPAATSVEFAEQLRPLIETALDAVRN